MTTEPAQDGGIPRRKFDDIASLYRPVVAGNGPSSAFPPHRPAFIPLPPTYTAPVRSPEPQQETPGTEVSARGVDDVPAASPVRIAPTAPVETKPETRPESRIEPTVELQRPTSAETVRSGPTEIPWPDAFQPRPNYRKPERSNWTWLLLIPAGIVAAVAITMIDPRSIRSWVETTLLHRTPATGTLSSPLLPDAFRSPSPATVAPTPNAPMPSSPTPSSPTPSSQAPSSSTPTPTPTPTPATPTPTTASPVTETPTSPDSTQAPAMAIPPAGSVPAPAAASVATPIHVNIQFRRNIPGADGEARRIAALLQSSGGSTELHPNATTVRAPTINYYNPADKDAASALATVLVNEATSWIVRLGTTKNPPGTIDVWLP